MNGPQLAVRLQVKKEGPNQGRFFYTCREPRDLGAVPGQCGFFLWEEAAQEREKKAESRPVQHSEYVPDFANRELMPRLPWFPPYGEGLHFVDEPYFGCYEVEDYGWAPDSTVDDDLDSVKVKKEDMDDSASGLSAIKPSKRKRPATAAAATMREEKEYGDLESDEERQLVRILESNPPHPSQEQQRRRTNVPAPALSQARTTSNTTTGTAMPHPATRTPNPQRTYDTSASMLTPTSRGNTTTSASEAGATKRVKLFSDTRGPSPPPSSTTTTTKLTTSTNLSQTQGRSYQTTPTGGGIGRPTTTTTTGPGSCDDYEITTSILSLLSSEKGVSDATRQAIRDKLNTYALRMRGVERGRDMTRAALKAKEAKEVELKARIEELERERKVAADKVRALRDGLGELFGDVDGCVDSGEGRA
ncbi:uncharacterized protein NCU03265 [Neurospora crassa OR74A]|nr:uncharacterized protein NCU03265 [Neurospora crassa OR74A]ESA44082.1 hypothetical protein, variant [Neurospora crassa OR74A]|eukprot:XP_011393127.1 uncharacterized protein NCU03265 [Neurospora crassa OR74A]